jgi:hypothetical protein
VTSSSSSSSSRRGACSASTTTWSVTHNPPENAHYVLPPGVVPGRILIVTHTYNNPHPPPPPTHTHPSTHAQGSYLVVDRILSENHFFGIRSLMTEDPLSDNT